MVGFNIPELSPKQRVGFAKLLHELFAAKLGDKFDVSVDAVNEGRSDYLVIKGREKPGFITLGRRIANWLTEKTGSNDYPEAQRFVEKFGMDAESLMLGGSGRGLGNEIGEFTLFTVTIEQAMYCGVKLYEHVDDRSFFKDNPMSMFEDAFYADVASRLTPKLQDLFAKALDAETKHRPLNIFEAAARNDANETHRFIEELLNPGSTISDVSWAEKLANAVQAKHSR